MESPLVSIILPLYNSQKYLSETIESIINQSYTNWELIITDDCSVDKSYDIAKSYSLIEKRILIYKLDKNRGAGIARNNSIIYSKGRFIAFCDSDDQWKSTKLETQVNFMIKNKYSFTCSGFDIINKDGKYIDKAYQCNNPFGKCDNCCQFLK